MAKLDVKVGSILFFAATAIVTTVVAFSCSRRKPNRIPRGILSNASNEDDLSKVRDKPKVHIKVNPPPSSSRVNYFSQVGEIIGYDTHIAESCISQDDVVNSQSMLLCDLPTCQQNYVSALDSIQELNLTVQGM